MRCRSAVKPHRNHSRSSGQINATFLTRSLAYDLPRIGFCNVHWSGATKCEFLGDFFAMVVQDRALWSYDVARSEASRRGLTNTLCWVVLILSQGHRMQPMECTPPQLSIARNQAAWLFPIPYPITLEKDNGCSSC